METLAVYSFGYAGIKAMHIATLKLVKLQHNDEISISVKVKNYIDWIISNQVLNKERLNDYRKGYIIFTRSIDI